MRYSLTQLLDDIAGGCSDAVADLHDRVKGRIHRRSEKFTKGRHVTPLSAEDVAQEGFSQVVLAVIENGWPASEHRARLNQLLDSACFQKANRAEAANLTLKRSAMVGQVGGDAAIETCNREAGYVDLRQVDIDDQIANLAPDARQITKMLYEGHSNSEISNAMGVSIRTVQRRVSEITFLAETWVRDD